MRLLFFVCLSLAAQERPTLVLSNAEAQVAVDLLGGSIVRFQFNDQKLNPLVWANTGPVTEARAMSHFLCLDRWGQPSDAELKNGMFFHGEATHVKWEVVSSTSNMALLRASLPMAGLSVERAMGLVGPVLSVTETVTNTNKLGRVYNMVQHPSLGPPFLDETTVVDSNARRGFMQSSPLPNPEDPAVVWPQALKDGIPVDLRHLKDDPMPNVVSFVIDDERGWVTAVSKGLLIGYTWLTSDYPWLNIWRHVQDGKPLARGIEFGTTGLHQPFPILVKKGRIFDRPLLDYLDAGESRTRMYSAFLMKAPAGYRGVQKLEILNGKIVVHERETNRTASVP